MCVCAASFPSYTDSTVLLTPTCWVSESQCPSGFICVCVCVDVCVHVLYMYYLLFLTERKTNCFNFISLFVLLNR